MARVLTAIVLTILASACADTPLVPTPETPVTGTDRISRVIGSVDMVLSDDDPPIALGEIPYYFDGPSGPAVTCAPCGVVAFGDRVPRTVVLTWTGDFSLYAWVEGETRDGKTVVNGEYYVGASYGRQVGREMRINGPWALVTNPRLKVGFPVSGTRVNLDAPQHITVTMWD